MLISTSRSLVARRGSRTAAITSKGVSAPVSAASVRSAWARTVLMMWAASVVVRPWSSRMSA